MLTNAMRYIVQIGTICCVARDIVGFYSQEGQSECTPCSPGTFQSEVGQSSCLPCDHGLVCRLHITVILQTKLDKHD